MKKISCDVFVTIATPTEWEYFANSCSISGYERGDVLTFYHVDSVPGTKIVATCFQCAGKTTAAHLTEKSLQFVEPKLIVPIGTSGSIYKDVKLGDVFVAREVSDFGNDAKVVGKRELRLIPSPKYYNIEPKLVRYVQEFPTMHKETYRAWQESRRLQTPTIDYLRKNLSHTVPDLHMGKMATVDFVVCAQKQAQKILQFDRKISLLDMETAAILEAATDREEPISVLPIRSPSDLANHLKDRLDSDEINWKQIAIGNCASFLLMLLSDLSFRELLSPNIVQC